MKKNYCQVLLLFFLLSSLSCGLKFLSKEAFDEIISLNSDEYDVYCSGYYASGPNPRACYWKNYNIIPLEPTNQSTALTIEIYGDDVYAGGYCWVAGWENACYWKNGDRHFLPFASTATNSRVTSITIKSGLVCAAGYDTISGVLTTCFWINDIQYTLGAGYANSIFVDDNIKIYIVGSGTNGFYWNAEMSSPVNFIGDIMGISVNTGNIYLANTNGNIYKNNFITPIYNIGAGTQHIFVYENDIYASNNTTKSYYKNNEMYVLPSAGWIRNLYVFKNKVFTAGNDGSNACFWENQSQIYLEPSGTASYAYDIKVVKKR